MPLISVLIVVYNPSDEFIACLDGLTSISDHFQLEIIVVDNHSNNDFLPAIKPNYPQVRFIHSDKNLGFGGGNNLAFKHSSGDYIMCVNPDLVMNEDSLSQLMPAIQDDLSVGIVGPKTLDGNGQLIYTARVDYTIPRLTSKYLGFEKIFPNLVYGDYPYKMNNETMPFEAEWLAGSCLLIRRDTYAAIKGFDDEFFLYLEDTDICHRVRQMDLKILYVPQAIVSHVGGATTSKYPRIRVRSYHHSPIHYHRKQGHLIGIGLLKFVFALELGAKILSRTSLNLIQPNEARQKHLHAEIQVLKELWSY